MAQARIGGQVFDLVANGVLDVGDDEDANAKRVIEGGDDSVIVRRIPTTTNGKFLGNGNFNLAPNGTVGSAGDYFRMAVVEVDDVATAGNAGVYLTQLSDEIFAQGTSGLAITNTTTQTFTIGAIALTPANTLADRTISFEFTPTGLPKYWFTTKIVSHGQFAASSSASNIQLTLRDAPPEGGSVPSNWIIHGPQAVQLLDPSTPKGVYEVRRQFKSRTGGFVLWTGARVISCQNLGTFSG